MFEKNYKNAMDSITPDDDTKEKILNQIELKREIKKRKNPATPWRIVFACVVCAAIVLGAVFIPRNTNNADQSTPTFPVAETQTDSVQLLTNVKTYDKIYEIIKESNQYYEDEGFDLYVKNELASDTMGVAPGATTNGNDSNAVNQYESEQDDFSNTTEQVEGVSEADIVKTDGEYIYYVLGGRLNVFTAQGENSKLVSQTELENEYANGSCDMFLKDDRLMMMRTDVYPDEGSYTEIAIYDISDRSNPKKVSSIRQNGFYNTSRMVGDYIYIVSNYYIDLAAADLDDPCTFVPYTEVNGVCQVFPADSIYYYKEGNHYPNQYTVIGSYNYKNGELKDTTSLLGGTDNVYCSKGNILLTNMQFCGSPDEGSDTYVQEKTVVSKLSIAEGNIEYKLSGTVDGRLENQFYIDEYDGYFRFVTTVTTVTQTVERFENIDHDVISRSSETTARLTVLDQELKKTGEILDLAKGERVYSARFMGDVAYFVTFRQTDPLFSADLSDPANPKILGELKIPGFSEYMYPYGDGLLLGFGMNADENTGRTNYLKLSMFNTANPANVTEQDVTIIDGYTYSTALDNHKSMLVSPDKNLIGFVAHARDGSQQYMLYRYTDEGFALAAEIAPPFENTEDYWKYWDDVRGLFVGDDFYIVSQKGLQVLDMNTFSQTAIVVI